MSFDIYISLGDIPKVKDFIFVVESYIVYCGIPDNEFCRFVLKDIEKGIYKDKVRFVDRFGDNIQLFDLSTSSKALICISSFPNKVINGMELGNNCGDCLFKLKSGSVYLDREKLGVDIPVRYGSNIDVVVNGKRFTNALKLYEYVEEYL